MANVYFEKYNSLSVFRIFGAPTVDELLAAVAEHGAKVEGNIIYDYTVGQLSHLTQADFNRLVRAAIEHMPNRTPGKTAIVTNTNIDFGLSRMYTAIPLHDDTHNHVFLVCRCFDDAKKLVTI